MSYVRTIKEKSLLKLNKMEAPEVDGEDIEQKV